MAVDTHTARTKLDKERAEFKRLLLENPNSQSLNLLGYDYQLWIEGKSVAQGVSQQAVNLPPMGQTVAEVPITVQLPSGLPQPLPSSCIS